MDYPIPLLDQLGQHLRSLRKARGLSQTQLATLLGVTQARVATIERDPSVVSVGQLFEIIRLLGAQWVLRDLQHPSAGANAVSSQPKGEW